MIKRENNGGNEMRIEEIKRKADKIVKLSDLQNLLQVIAKRMIKEQGFYAYQNDKYEKIFVEN